MNRYELYEQCVQSPAIQTRFLRALHDSKGKGVPRARVLGEDFAGPAAIARHWAALGEEYSAIATDRDREPMEHAKTAAAGTFDPGSLRRISWRVRDVLRPPPAGAEADVIAAFNFAVCELHERADLLQYLKNSHARLNRGGIFAADLYFGPGAWRRGIEKKKVRTAQGIINYEWEQRSANPLTGRVENVIHFVLPRGKKMRNAFVYDWRLWSVAELRDAMTEAGFRSTEVHNTYGGAIDENGDPVPLAVNDGRELNEENNVVYIVARR